MFICHSGLLSCNLAPHSMNVIWTNRNEPHRRVCSHRQHFDRRWREGLQTTRICACYFETVVDHHTHFLWWRVIAASCCVWRMYGLIVGAPGQCYVCWVRVLRDSVFLYMPPTCLGKVLLPCTIEMLMGKVVFDMFFFRSHREQHCKCECIAFLVKNNTYILLLYIL